MAAIKSTTIAEQISILKLKGMIITNVSFASNILKTKNYYNVINAFKECFIDKGYVKVNDSDVDEKYIIGTTFEELYSLYDFDVNLRNLFLKYILLFENEFKTVFSRELATTINSSPYFNDKIYGKIDQKDNIKQIISKKITDHKD